MLACDWLHLETIGSCFNAISICLFASFSCNHPHSLHDTTHFFHLSSEALSIEQVLKLFPLTFLSYLGIFYAHSFSIIWA
jgi:hypothetical protein